MDFTTGAAIIASVSTGLKGLSDTAKNIRDIIGPTAKKEELQKAREQLSDLLERFVDIQSNVLDLKMANNALVEEIQKLQKELTAINDFKIEAEKYELIYGIYPGMRGYIKKEGATDNEKKAPLCAKCFEEGKLSAYSFTQRGYGQDLLSCSECKSTWIVNNENQYNVHSV